MNLIQMVIAILHIFVRCHLVSRALEAHTVVTPRTCNSKAAIDPDTRHFATFIGTVSASALDHVFLEVFITLTDLHHIFTFYAWVDCLLAEVAVFDLAGVAGKR